MMRLFTCDRLFLTLSLLFLCQFLAIQVSAGDGYIKRMGIIKLPTIFNWTLYKKSFQKLYPTIRDELARKKLFIASALRTFAHNLRFRVGLSSYYLSVNQFSDRTHKELRAMYSFKHEDSTTNTIDDVKLNLEGLSGDELKQELTRIMQQRAPGYKMWNNQVGTGKEGRHQREKRSLKMSKKGRKSIQNNRHSRIKIDEFRSLSSPVPPESDKVVEIVPSDNPNYEPVDFRGKVNNIETIKSSQGLPEDQLSYLERLPGVNLVKRIYTKLFSESDDEFDDLHAGDHVDYVEDGEFDDIMENNKRNESIDREHQDGADYDEFSDLMDSEYMEYVEDDEFDDIMDMAIGGVSGAVDSVRHELKDLDNEGELQTNDYGHLDDSSQEFSLHLEEIPLDNNMTIGGEDNRVPTYYVTEMLFDLRDSRCLFLPRDQHDCGSCYAFASIAVLEYWHCRKTGMLVPFSEQYMVDCGKHSELNGCSGGSLANATLFNIDWGVQLHSSYPYVAQQGDCPYTEDQWEEAAFKRPALLAYLDVTDRSNWPTVLEVLGPILIGMRVPSDFHLHGGLVHSGDNCNDYMHAMVVVGHGIEDGEEFWLMRNSHGHYWGESGYFKLSKSASDDCYSNLTARVTVYDFVKQPVLRVQMKGDQKIKVRPSQELIDE